LFFRTLINSVPFFQIGEDCFRPILLKKSDFQLA
jgi:hypothetical protein